MLPGIFLIMVILPYHTRLTKNNLIQHFLRGASWATIGFLYVAGVRLWIDSCLINKYTNYVTGSINIIICLGLLEIRLIKSKMMNWRIYKVLLSGKNSYTDHMFLKVCLPLEESLTPIVSNFNDDCMSKVIFF